MAKLYFRYSSMNAGKSLSLITVAYNYIERGKKVLILTSAHDDRYGVNLVKSRVGVEMPAIGINDRDNILHIVKKQLKQEKTLDCVLVDEAQFLKKHHIFELADVVDIFEIPVISYGLRSDFMQQPFEGSQYLMAIADDIEELKTICFCGKKATVNARVCNGEIVREGDQILIGGNESYISLCRRHFKEGRISE